MPDGTMLNPLPTNTAAVEPKVKAMAIVMYLVSLVLVGIGQLLQDGTLLTFLPVQLNWLSVVILPLIPTALSAIAGFYARHQWRSPQAPTNTLNPPVAGTG